jgi:transposase
MNQVSRNFSRNECVEVATLASEECSHRALSQRFGVSQSTISWVMQRYRETGDHVRRPGQGRHQATTPAQDRHLRFLAVRKRFTNTRRLQMQLAIARRTNVRIVLETIRQRLLEDNLHIRHPAIGALLTAAHRQAWLQFSENHTTWNDNNELARVLFSDESGLESSDRRVRVI